MLPKSGCKLWRWMWYMALLLFVFLIALLYYSPSFRCLTRELKASIRNSARHPVLVLIWFWPFNRTFDLDLCSSQFNINNCVLTADRDAIYEADAVLIHHRNIALDASNLPQDPRPPHQKWIWMNFESPSNAPQIPGLDDLFNISLSYRKDADISMPYGSLVLHDHPYKNFTDFVPAQKDKLVCWIVSNYNPEHRRLQYYTQLNKYIPIHVYGNMFENQVSEEEYEKIISSCKFYLSFENSVHKDYITEKLFNALDLGAVPIAFGPSRQNYECFVPGDAFIHVNDFPTIMALAKHILHLHQNDAMYLRYFRWRRRFRVKKTVFPVENTCQACEYIRQNRQYQVLTNLCQWFWYTSDGLK
ncbi:4-galactosyl-N-acetylglucosaminide 3-alpha-L-fucosyltransferase 9-like [Clarias gariepinus]|uniref:4-galactosyl-N-acetylglucosaminide 3-alpha-L-fucosyltransferase 9-like n=1 Tax=Clarias gariepinus TaxID=13013 RepID=UPI00234CB1C6|nr:4-galactosyl-N-acetylglucosaminide 3-alpha-L-fucosyltransferase 9-like [Clarias gariepinus]